AGTTGSSNFPTDKPFQPALSRPDDQDAFVLRIDNTLTSLAWSSYLGGGGDDHATEIAVDRDGNAYVTGDTKSTNFPTSRAFQSAKGGGFVDAFVTGVSPAGNSFVSSSYLGGRDDDQGSGIALDRNGDIAVVGYTNSADFPIAKAFQPARGGGVGDAFVAKV